MIKKKKRTDWHRVFFRHSVENWAIAYLDRLELISTNWMLISQLPIFQYRFANHSVATSSPYLFTFRSCLDAAAINFLYYFVGLVMMGLVISCPSGKYEERHGNHIISRRQEECSNSRVALLFQICRWLVLFPRRHHFPSLVVCSKGIAAFLNYNPLPLWALSISTTIHNQYTCVSTSTIPSGKNDASTVDDGNRLCASIALSQSIETGEPYRRKKKLRKERIVVPITSPITLFFSQSFQGRSPRRRKKNTPSIFSYREDDITHFSPLVSFFFPFTSVGWYL